MVRVLRDGRTEPASPPAEDALEAYSHQTAARLVRLARERLGLTQAAMAERLRLPAGTLRDWEQGRRMPDAAAVTLLRLAAGAPQAIQRLTTRFASPLRAAAYLERFAAAAGRALLRTEIALVLRHSPFDARALAEAATSAPEKLKRAIATAGV
ncbi:MAG: helix-turn-helix domain-containing protein [Rhodospirillales bacterium]